MKKLIFINCVLALAVIFTYCAKPDATEESNAINTGAAVGERTTCTVTNIPPVNTADLSFCGIDPFGEPCLNCGGGANGSAFFLAGVPVSFNVSAPITFWVKPSKATSINLTTGSGAPTGWVFIPNGQCARFYVDANCNITQVK